MAATSPILIIGAGPAGLTIAACLQKKQIPSKIVDRYGIAGGSYLRVYPEITLASPSRYNGLPGLPLETEGEYTKISEYQTYLRQYATENQLTAEKANVEKIEKKENDFLVTFSATESKDTYTENFSIVVVATGMFEFPIRPEIEGLPENGPAEENRPAVYHVRDWKGPKALKEQEKKVVIIGGATSAIEIAEQCAQVHLPVTLSARGRGVNIWPQRLFGKDLHDLFSVVENLPLWTARSFCRNHPTVAGTDLGFKKFQQQNLITTRGEIAKFEQNKAIFKEGEPDSFDVILLATGYRFDTPFLPPAVKRVPAGYPLAYKTESPSWPGLYFIGLPCINRVTSEFLRGISKDGPFLAKLIEKRLKTLKKA